MTAIVPTISYRVTATVVAATSGDGDTIAAAFNGLTIGGVDVAGAATATNASGTVTIWWPASAVRAGNDLILNQVTNIISGISTLTSPVYPITVRTEGRIV